MTNHFMKQLPDLGVVHRVIGEWGIFEFVLCVIFFPISLFYIGFRILQESARE